MRILYSQLPYIATHGTRARQVPGPIDVATGVAVFV